MEETDSEDEDYLDIRNLHPRLPGVQKQEEQEVMAPEVHLPVMQEEQEQEEQEVMAPEVHLPVMQEQEEQ